MKRGLFHKRQSDNAITVDVRKVLKVRRSTEASTGEWQLPWVLREV